MKGHIEISKERLIELLDSHPEWRFLHFDDEYVYDSKRKTFTWEGWDDYNDDMGKIVYFLNPSKKKMKDIHFVWTHFTIKGHIIHFWDENQWSRRKKEKKTVNCVFFLQVLQNIGAGELI